MNANSANVISAILASVAVVGPGGFLLGRLTAPETEAAVVQDVSPAYNQEHIRTLEKSIADYRESIAGFDNVVNNIHDEMNTPGGKAGAMAFMEAFKPQFKNWSEVFDTSVAAVMNAVSCYDVPRELKEEAMRVAINMIGRSKSAWMFAN